MAWSVRDVIMSLRGGAVRQRLPGVAAVGGAGAVVAGHAQADAAGAQHPQHAARHELTARPHGSVPLATALLGDGAVILADERLVLRHEALGVGVGVHLRPQRLGQVAPYVLVEVGVGVLEPFADCLAAEPSPPLVLLPLRVLRLLVALPSPASCRRRTGRRRPAACRSWPGFFLPLPAPLARAGRRRRTGLADGAPGRVRLAGGRVGLDFPDCPV